MWYNSERLIQQLFKFGILEGCGNVFYLSLTKIGLSSDDVSMTKFKHELGAWVFQIVICYKTLNTIAAIVKYTSNQYSRKQTNFHIYRNRN